jgi:hypothetical protein
MESRIMLNKLTAFALAYLVMGGIAYAETCPSASSFHKLADENYTSPGPNGSTLKVNVVPDIDDAALKSLKFTSARLQDKDSADAKVICRYENTTAGGSLGWPTGKPVQGTGSGWNGNDCEANDTASCSFN